MINLNQSVFLAEFQKQINKHLISKSKLINFLTTTFTFILQFVDVIFEMALFYNVA